MAKKADMDLERGIIGSDPDAVQAALRHGADANARWDRMRPLHMAVVLGGPQIVRMLLNAGASKDCRDHLRRTPLHYAAMGLTTGREHSEEVVRILLAAGAAIDAKDEIGRTPLDYALWMRNRAAEKELIAAGARGNRQFVSWVTKTAENASRQGKRSRQDY